MPSENDPLLPAYPPAPEISGHGFSAPREPDGLEIVGSDFYSLESPERLQDGRYGTLDPIDIRGENTQTEKSSLPNQETGESSRPVFSGDQGEESDQGSGESSDAIRKATISQAIAIFTFLVAAFFVFILGAGGTAGDGPDGGWPRPLPVPKHPSSPSLSLDQRVENILNETPLFDGHNDLAIFIRGEYKNHINAPSFRDKFSSGDLKGHVDIPRLRSGQVGGSFWSAFVPCPLNASYSFTDPTYSTSVSTTLSQIDLVRRVQAHYSSVFSPATAPLSSALSAFHSHNPPHLISPISIEGLHQLPPSAPLSTLRLYSALGVKAATLTWNCHNIVADSALISDFDPDTQEYRTIIAPGNYRDGITPLGRRVLHEMNRLGMIVDLSHTSYWTQKSVLTNTTTLAPVIFSHSSVFSICPHPRNVRDDILDLVKENGGVVMINFTPEFVSCYMENGSDPSVALPTFYERNSTIEHVVKHVLYVGQKIGFDYVGFGSDFDGTEHLPTNLTSGVSSYPLLVRHLLSNPDYNLTDSEASKVVGGNLLRVWKSVDQVAEKLRADEDEGEDEVGGYWSGSWL